MLLALDGFTWLTGHGFTGLITAIALALLGGIFFAWLYWFVERHAPREDDGCAAADVEGEMTADTKEIVLTALRNDRGDDVERARRAFAGLSPEQMAQVYGQSGRTRADILAAYEAHEARIDRATREVQSL